MSSAARMIYLHAITPVHSGTGQTAAIVDLPIAREKATGYPMIPASSLKGVLREALLKPDNQKWIDKAFGKPPTSDATDNGNAGALCFGDQRILCLPVRSYFGTFAYVTCPFILNRLERDMKAFDMPPLIAPVANLADTEATLPIHLPERSVLANGGKVYLEDLDLAVTVDTALNTIAASFAALVFPDAHVEFTSRFALVSNDVFSFLTETATEVTARVVLKAETKTTDNLWYEETVPAEAIFFGPALVEARHQGDASLLEGLQAAKRIQIGGDASVGRGMCRVVVTNG